MLLLVLPLTEQSGSLSITSQTPVWVMSCAPSLFSVLSFLSVACVAVSSQQRALFDGSHGEYNECNGRSSPSGSCYYSLPGLNYLCLPLSPSRPRSNFQETCVESKLAVSIGAFWFCHLTFSFSLIFVHSLLDDVCVSRARCQISPLILT